MAYEFARRVFKLLKPEHHFGRTSADFGAKARRPAYSVLAHDKLVQLGLEGADLAASPSSRLGNDLLAIKTLTVDILFREEYHDCIVYVLRRKHAQN